MSPMERPDRRREVGFFLSWRDKNNRSTISAVDKSEIERKSFFMLIRPERRERLTAGDRHRPLVASVGRHHEKLGFAATRGHKKNKSPVRRPARIFAVARLPRQSALDAG